MLSAVFAGLLIATASLLLGGAIMAIAGLPRHSAAAPATGISALLVAAIPFATSGRIGILGQGLVNDDMASHLLFTEWISSHAGPTPDLIKDGYPLGPHAIVAATAK